MIRLFIENQEIELNESVQFAVTKQFEDITNPTTIINDWSKTVSIPFSQKNNKIFGGLFNADRLTVSRDIPVDYMKILTHTPIIEGTWDEATGTMTSTRTTNTNPTSNDFRLVGFKGNTIYSAFLVRRTTLGSSSYTFAYNPDNYTTIYVVNNGNIADTGFYLDISSLESGQQYTFSFSVVELDRTSTGNAAKVTHIVLTKGSNVVTWEDIYDEQLTGIYFNPLRKLDFRLVWDDSVVMTGYAKVNEVKQNEGKGTYEITLFGQLGKVLQEMQKITFDSTTEDTKYLIDGSKYVDENVNISLIASSWAVSTNNGQNRSDLQEKYITTRTNGEITKTLNPNYNVNDIIGWAPNNAFSEGFEYDTFQNALTASMKFTDVLGDSFKTDTGIEPDTAIPDGMTPRGIGEYRSYLQLPFIYWNKLFQVFQAKAEEVTGYKFNLDSSWFNTSNPYWYNLVYMLSAFNPKKGEKFNNEYSGSGSGSELVPDYTYSTQYDISNPDWTERKISKLTGLDATEELPIYNTSTATFSLKADSHTKVESFNIIGGFCMTNVTAGFNVSQWVLSPDNALIINLKLTGENGSVVRKKCVVYSQNASASIVNFANSADVKLTIKPTYGFRTILDNNNICYVWNFSLSIPTFELLTYNFSDSVTAELEYYTYINSNPINTNAIPLGTIAAIGLDISTDISVNLQYFRSNSEFVLNDLWNKDYNLFQQILNYCKMYRIGISVDDVNKTISFKPIVKYMQDYTVEDWTNKIDKSKDYTIKPITFEDKYVLFNYDDDETKLGEEYKEKFGFNYGDYRLTTDYNFNSETNELFEGVKTSINNTDNVLSWNNLNTYHNIIYSFPAELYVYNQDKDGKQVDVFGRFYFRNGRNMFSTESSLHLVSPRVTDDTNLQTSTNTYFYSQGYNYARVYGYPKLDVVYGNNMCIFNVPNQNYTYLNNYSGKGSIYTNFWQKYLDERYNTQNKVITCYVDLAPTDWTNFAFNHFVKVGNQLCIVNKIYDYDITNNETTKVDLITVQDISGYTNDNYNG